VFVLLFVIGTLDDEKELTKSIEDVKINSEIREIKLFLGVIRTLKRLLDDKHSANVSTLKIHLSVNKLIFKMCCVFF
jgi:hypothetical protein